MHQFFSFSMQQKFVQSLRGRPLKEAFLSLNAKISSLCLSATSLLRLPPVSPLVALTAPPREHSCIVAAKPSAFADACYIHRLMAPGQSLARCYRLQPPPSPLCLLDRADVLAMPALQRNGAIAVVYALEGLPLTHLLCRRGDRSML